MKKILQAVHYPIRAKLQIPGSKSISNRALLLAALAEGRSEIANIQVSDDIRAMIKGLQALGVVIELNEASQTAFVTGSKGFFLKQGSKLHCAESGTMARFMLTACAAVAGEYYFDAAASLQKRPLHSLFKVIEGQGVQLQHLSTENFPLRLCSPRGLSGGELRISAAETSQVVSALLMMAPFMRAPLFLSVENLVSCSYVEMTCSMMADFSVQVTSSKQHEFSVPQFQHYQARYYQVEPDLSTASYFFAAAAVTAGELSIQPFQRAKTKQGDVIFLSLLEQMGCEVHESESGLSIKGTSHLQGITVNMSTCPDVFMTLAALAPFAETPTLITGIGHVRYKESDRLSAMSQGLKALAVRIEEGNDWLKIYPSPVQAGIVNSKNDHRLAMAFSVLGLRVPGVIIEGAEAVAKSCPEFFELWGKMLA